MKKVLLMIPFIFIVGIFIVGILLLSSTPTLAANNAQSQILTPAHAASSAQSHIFAYKADCGSSYTDYPVIGQVKFQRRYNTVSVNVTLQHASPNTLYAIELWEAYCSYYTTFGSITTNSKGAGHGNFATTVPSNVTQFFVTAYGYGDGYYNDTTTVTLPFCIGKGC